MSQKSKAERLRELLRISKMLRQHVAETDDPYYVELFLKAASALEDRAACIANHGTTQCGQKLNIIC